MSADSRLSYEELAAKNADLREMLVALRDEVAEFEAAVGADLPEIAEAAVVRLAVRQAGAEVVAA